jgi:hypothetical protein
MVGVYELKYLTICSPLFEMCGYIAVIHSRAGKTLLVFLPLAV